MSSSGDVMPQHLSAPASFVLSQRLSVHGNQALVRVLDTEERHRLSKQDLLLVYLCILLGQLAPGFSPHTAVSMGPEAQMKVARGRTFWGAGINDYTRVNEEWRDDRQLEGQKVEAV